MNDQRCSVAQFTDPIRGALFTDLDGTLLDPDSYQPSAEAVAAVARLAQRAVVTVPVTSKTSSEVRHLESTIRFAGLRVVEGGAVIAGGGGDEEVVGAVRPQLVEVLEALKSEGWRVRGFSDMTAVEISKLTGLDVAAAKRANERRASEPFVVIGEWSINAAQLARSVLELGASLSRGGRLWHLLGSGIDKGSGVREVLARLPALGSGVIAAVGDAWNDLPMLYAAHRGYLLGTAVEDVDLPGHVFRIRTSGPAGFVQAAHDLENHLRERALGERRGQGETTPAF